MSADDVVASLRRQSAYGSQSAAETRADDEMTIAFLFSRERERERAGLVVVVLF